MQHNVVTLKDIAEVTGYSINTVSRALKNCEDISVNTRSKIQDLAAEMGYVKNSLASSLRSGRTGIIAVIISDISNPLFGIMVKDIEEQLEKANYCTIVLNTNENFELERKAISISLSKKVDGIIICPAQENEDNIKFLISSKVPFVLMGRKFETIHTNYVVWDDIHGGYLATKYLLENGHSNILFLNGPLYISSAKERLEGLKKAYEEKKIPLSKSCIREIRVNGNNIGEILNEVLREGIEFTAVLTFNDMIAWAVLTELNYHAMENIKVIGFDNIESRFCMPYHLTSVNTPKKKMAALITDILLQKIVSDNETIICKIIPVNLCLGNKKNERYAN